MRLAQLRPVQEDTYSYHDREDHRDLIRELASELGYKRPSLWRYWDEETNAFDAGKDTEAAIAMFRHAINSGKPSEHYPKIYGALVTAVNSKLRDTEEMVKSFKTLEELAAGHLPTVIGLGRKLEEVENQLEHARESLKMTQEVWQLLAAFNQIAMTTVHSGFSPEDVKWRASIARAGLRKMGIEPVADDGV